MSIYIFDNKPFIMKKNILFFAALLLLNMILSCNHSKQQTTGLHIQKEGKRHPDKTIENLKRAIKGEITAQAKYETFAKKAEKEGFKNISKLFTATSQAESIHVRNHKSSLTNLDVPFDIAPDNAIAGSTIQNLQNAIDGETYESTDMYSTYIEIANDEKTNSASMSFNRALEAEKRHAQIYKNTLKMLQTYGNDRKISTTWYVCPMCGNVYGKPEKPEICEICNIGADTFISVK